MYLISFLDKTTFGVVNHPLDTPEDMENFIHQELGKDIRGWRAMVEESKGGEIISETDLYQASVFSFQSISLTYINNIFLGRIQHCQLE